MRFNDPFLKRVFASALLFLCFGLAVHAKWQAPPEPSRAQLLNSLQILLSQRPGDQNVLLKLRIHSGAAFDLADKAGKMALLGDLLFPDPATREYFIEEMDGRLEVNTNHDAINITLQGRAAEFEQIIDILRTALVTTQITPENVSKAQEGRIKIIRDTSISPTVLADRAIASRLFGDFPYGNPHGGTAESLARIDRADLMLARDRFLNPNNATLVIIGGVERARAMRALRQLLGGWRKSEKIVPATFRQPEPPDPRLLLVNIPADDSAEIRLATRGLARSDADNAAANMLAMVAQKRWQRLLPELTKAPVFVRHRGYFLPGIFVFGASVNSSLAVKAIETARSVAQSLVENPVSTAELDEAKRELLAETNKKLAEPDGLADAWLDIHTYRLPSLPEQLRGIQAVTAGDLQRTATRIFRPDATAAVVMGNTEVLRPELERAMRIEILGEIDPEPVTPDSKASPIPGAPVGPE